MKNKCENSMFEEWINKVNKFEIRFKSIEELKE
jgi:hypothetical protein